MNITNTIKILVIILFSLSDYALGCDCKDLRPLEKVRQMSINESDIIFLGELIEIDTANYTYSFRIIEKFKGEHNDSIINGKLFGSCSVFPSDRGKWIVYAKVKEDMINISECLASRSEKNPICLNCYQIPSPLSRYSNKKEKKKFILERDSLRNKAIEDWNNEIEFLRRQKQ